MWADKLVEELKEDAPPENAVTAADLVSRTGRPFKTCSEALLTAFRNGRLKRAKYRKQWHYFP